MIALSAHFDPTLIRARSVLRGAGMLADGMLQPEWSEGRPDLGGR